MGHGGRADLASDGALAEVAQADVGPHVPVKVQQHGVEARGRVVQLCDVIVRLYLRQVSTLLTRYLSNTTSWYPEVKLDSTAQHPAHVLDRQQ